MYGRGLAVSAHPPTLIVVTCTPLLQSNLAQIGAYWAFPNKSLEKWSVKKARFSVNWTRAVHIVMIVSENRTFSVVLVDIDFDIHTLASLVGPELTHFTALYFTPQRQSVARLFLQLFLLLPYLLQKYVYMLWLPAPCWHRHS
jgi:hypothetical protein